MFHTRLFHDVYSPNAAAEAVRPAPHSMLYVFDGSVAVDGTALTQGEAGYFRDDLSVEADASGATVWRWEVVGRDEPLGIVHAEGVSSRLRIARDVEMFELVPTSRWLFRLRHDHPF